MPAGWQSSDFPPPFDMIAMELWHPGKRETLRRQLIDGNAGEIEGLLRKLAYSSSLEPDQAEHPNKMRFMTLEQFLRGEAFKPGPPYLNAPPGLEWGQPQEVKPDEALGPSNPEGDAPGNRTKLNGKQLAAALRTAARALVEDPEYLEARSRRIDDGKAPGLRRLLWELANQKSREPEAFRPRKLPFCFISDYLPWDPAHDNMREQTDRMIAAKAREEEEARAHQAAGDRPATATPEEPSDPDQLEVYRDPPGREPYDPDR
jgi:hypothetical protein